MSQAEIQYDADIKSFRCTGHWNILNLTQTKDQTAKITASQQDPIVLDGAQVQAMDSAGALAIQNLIKACQKAGKKTHIQGFKDEQGALLSLVEKHQEQLILPESQKSNTSVLTWLGEETIQKLHQVDGFLQLIGDMFIRFAHGMIQWKRLHWSSVFSNMMSAGLKALPIVGLLSFLIGIVLTYQMGLQLQTYGANIYIAFIAGLAIFREFSPLITAIIVAGRTSSAFTAQIGSMTLNEEIDALKTMGLSPTELLVVPKVIALVLMFPLLIFWSDIFAIFGAMLMSKNMLSVNYVDFLSRLKSSVGIDQFMLGMYKAPAFAMIIVLVGCFQGFRVSSQSDSIGAQTTKSVVQALFLIIIADAIYSIIYSQLGL